jgi:RNA polymerase sigma factor (sigma-70 family)
VPKLATRAPAAEAPHAPPPGWENLLEGLVSGDLAATHKLTALITGYLVRSGAFDLKDSWADIIQESLTALLQRARRGGLRDPAALVHYALTVTRSKVNDWLARELRERRLQSQLEREPGAGLAGDGELRLDLGRALDCLPAPQRRALEEIYLRGHTYAEAARALGLSLRQVKRLQVRGLAALRRALDVDSPAAVRPCKRSPRSEA